MSLSVANVSAMRALQTSSFVDSSVVNTVYVASQDDFYRYVPGSTLTAADGLVYTSSDGLGQWTRMLIPSRKWTTQTTWSIDESNSTSRASDENTGADDAHPLLSCDELARRLGSSTLQQATTVRWLSDTTRYSLDLSRVNAGNQTGLTPATNYPLVFVGVPTVVRSGTLTGATDAPWSVADSSLPTSWSASGCLSTSSGTRIIRKTDGTKHAAMGYEDVAKTAKTSPTNGFAQTYTSTGTASISFANGDAYEVLSLPKFPRIMPPESVPNFTGCYFFYLDMQGVVGGSNEYRFCGWRAFSTLSGQTRGCANTVRGGIFVAGGSMSGQLTNTMSRSIFLGSSFQLFSWGGDMNGLINVVAKAGQLQPSHTSHGRLGIVYAYDCSGSAIQLHNNAAITLDGLHGSGNASFTLEIRDSGCSINSTTTTPLTAFDATTGAAKPISVVGTTYDYADIPISVPNKGAFFVTN